MNLFVISCPELTDADLKRIQAVRKEHHSLYSTVSPHFTLVFDVPDMSLTDFTAEIYKQAQHMRAIEFTIRCAMVNKDVLGNNYEAFLLPEEGSSRIISLHDKLYSDRLLRYLRPDICYLPHITIGSSGDAGIIKQIVSDWNMQEHPIKGVISYLEIINYEDGKVTFLDRMPLPA